MNITQIKAKLYDIEYHNCNGRLTVQKDGQRDPHDHPCSLCSQVYELKKILTELEKTS